MNERDRIFVEGWNAAADACEQPYPTDVFTPISDEELRRVRAVLDVHCDVRNPMERMHASWARHWARVLRDTAKEQQADA